MWEAFQALHCQNFDVSLTEIYGYLINFALPKLATEQMCRVREMWEIKWQSPWALQWPRIKGFSHIPCQAPVTMSSTMETLYVLHTGI